MRRTFHLDDPPPPARHEQVAPVLEPDPWATLADATPDAATPTGPAADADPPNDHAPDPAGTARVHLRALRRSPVRRSVGYAGGGLVVVGAIVAAGVSAGTPHGDPSAAADSDTNPAAPTEPPPLAPTTPPAPPPQPATPPRATAATPPPSTPPPAAAPGSQPAPASPTTPAPQPPHQPPRGGRQKPPDTHEPPEDTNPPRAAPALDPPQAARHAEAAVHADTALREARAAGAQPADPTDNPSPATSHLRTAVRALDKARSLLGDDPDDSTRAVITKAEAALDAARVLAARPHPDATSPHDDEDRANRGRTARPESPDDQPLARGTDGDLVRTAQHLLRNHGATLQATGAFDTQTGTAVRAFQRAHQLPTTGVIDATTWAALRSDPTPARQPIVQSPPSPQRSPLPPAPAPPPAPIPPAPSPPPPAPPQEPTQTRKYHTVVRGDTLGKIAADTGVTVVRLIELSGLPDSRIYVGEQLRLHDQVPNKIHRKPVTRATTPPPANQPRPEPKELHEAPMSECALLPLPISTPCYSNR